MVPYCTLLLLTTHEPFGLEILLILRICLYYLFPLVTSVSDAFTLWKGLYVVLQHIPQEKGKDPNAPKPNKTPFNFFSVDARIKAKDAFPEMSQTDITKKVPSSSTKT